MIFDTERTVIPLRYSTSLSNDYTAYYTTFRTRIKERDHNASSVDEKLTQSQKNPHFHENAYILYKKNVGKKLTDFYPKSEVKN